jgi:hypothetical protein
MQFEIPIFFQSHTHTAHTMSYSKKIILLQNYQQQRRRRLLLVALALLPSHPERPIVPVERFEFNNLGNASCREMFRYA